MGEDGLVGNLDELKNNVKRSGGNLLHKIKMFRHKGRSHHQGKILFDNIQMHIYFHQLLAFNYFVYIVQINNYQ